MRKRNKTAAIMLSIVISFSLLGCGKKESAYFLEEAVSASEGMDMQAGEIQDAKKQKEQSFGQELLEENSVNTQETEETVFFVYVCGAVQSPGVYELVEGSRVFEAIRLAGGFLEDACEDYVNQAGEVTDAMKIYIPTMSEIENGDFHKEEGNLDIGATSEKAESSLVNINTADKEKLMTLSGIGESRAEAILAYRENNGRFTKIEDIMQVSGIKEGAFAKIKDKICVE